MQRFASETIANTGSAVDQPDDPRTDGFATARLNLLYAQTLTGVISSIITGGLLALYLYAMGISEGLIYWYLAVLLVGAIRYALLVRFRKQGGAQAHRKFWLRSFSAFVMPSGILWGYAIFLPQPNDHAQVLITFLIIAGMAAGSATIYAASMPVLVAFNLPIVAFIVASLTRHPELLNLIGFVLIYFAMVLVGGWRTSQVFSKSLLLSAQNQDLVDRLQLEQQRISAINEQLESRVAERTTALQESNNRLEIEVQQKAKIQRSLEQSEAQYRTLYHANPSLFITIDARGIIKSINDYGLEFLGFDRHSLVGHPISRIIHDDGVSTLEQRLQDCLANSGDVQRWKSAFVVSNGETIWVRIVARGEVDAETHKCTSVHLVCEDITDAWALERELQYQASHDPLTSLYNRREFERRLQLIFTDRRHDDARYSLCCLDLDNFKVVNDTCGHVAGDQLLRRLGEILTRFIRSEDILARLGGDEFAMLMHNAPIDDAQKLVERLRVAIEEFSFEWESQVFHVTGSFGLTEIVEHHGTAADALRDADSACYAAKQNGRNRIHVNSQHGHRLGKLGGSRLPNVG
jgi:diguanylate cyclase (GGDEF)-like protein/PAS domain S-box-containing protein